MRRIRLIVVLIAAVAASLTGVSAASADEGVRAPEVRHLVPVVTAAPGGDVVTARASYRCWGPSDLMHLWVSVKQGGPDPTAEGSSSTVDAWYDTNVSGDVAVTCNGRWQSASVELGRHDTDFTGRPLGHLQRGAAWLQFCLVDLSNELLASENRWVQVVGAGVSGR